MKSEDKKVDFKEITVRDAYLSWAGWDPWEKWDQDRFDFDMATKIEPALKDFRNLCEAEGIEILELKAESRHPIGKALLALGCKNLGASRIIARIAKRA